MATEMLSWLSKLFERPHQEAIPQHRFTSPVRVEHNDKTIIVDDRAGTVSTLAWSQLGNVSVLTSEAGPFGIDLFWVLTDLDDRQSITVPMGAEGEHALLQAMQSRLTGFDNMAVVEAMSNTGHGVFQIWPPAEMS